MVQIHRTASCQGYFKWAKTICKHTHPETHTAAMQLQTHMMGFMLTHMCSSWEIQGLQPLSACWCCLSHTSVYLSLSQFISQLRCPSPQLTDSELSPSVVTCAMQYTSPVEFLILGPRLGDYSQVLFLLFQVKIIFSKPCELCCAPYN